MFLVLLAVSCACCAGACADSGEVACSCCHCSASNLLVVGVVIPSADLGAEDIKTLQLSKVAIEYVLSSCEIFFPGKPSFVAVK